MQQRHIPGPITREKLEASEQRNEGKRNLIPLVRSDKKMDSLKKTDSQVAFVLCIFIFINVVLNQWLIN